MRTASFRKARLPQDTAALAAFDRKVFQGDAFDAEDWSRLESYWMIAGGRRVGCCAFERDRDFDGAWRRGSLYIVSTGILPEHRGKGLGERFKRWQIAWARRRGFTRIVTNSRCSNQAMIRLNEKHGFQRIGITTGNYYSQPAEAAVVMELKLGRVEAILALLIVERDRLERAIDALQGVIPAASDARSGGGRA